MLGQEAAEQRVHAGLEVAHRHCASGVAMIAAPESKQRLARAHTLVDPVLHRHLHGDLDRDRAGVREEHPLEVARHQRGEPLRQHIGLLMREPAQHHMRHHRELPLDRGTDVRVVVAMAGRPPRRHAVDQLGPVVEHDAAALGPGDNERPPHRLHLHIGQPDMLKPRLVPGGRLFFHAGRLSFHASLI